MGLKWRKLKTDEFDFRGVKGQLMLESEKGIKENRMCLVNKHHEEYNRKQIQLNKRLLSPVRIQ